MKVILLTYLLFFGCDGNNQKHTNSYKIPKKPSLNNNQISTLPFKWVAPSHWIANDKSAMRSASYLIPSSNGSADLSVIYLNGDGGGIAANVNRWRKQLNLDELNNEEIESDAENLSGNLGTYKIYEIINSDNKESAFLCAIIPGNNFTIFVKLNTYVDNLNNFKDEFIKFSSSFEYNE